MRDTDYFSGFNNHKRVNLRVFVSLLKNADNRLIPNKFRQTFFLKIA